MIKAPPAKKISLYHHHSNMAWDPQKNSWVLFGLAAICILSASLYAWLNRGGSGASPPASADDGGDEPGFVDAMPAAPVNPSPIPQIITTNAPTTNPPATGTVGVIPVYPGGWAWNPAWHNSYYWDMRRDPYWRYDWRFHGDGKNRVWGRTGPYVPGHHR